MASFPSLISDPFRPALEILLRASGYAQECNADHWQFAVDLTQLLDAGATLTEIRWLIHRGYATHAKETTIPGDPQRSFRPLAATSFPADTCLVPTAIGATEIQAALGPSQTQPQSLPLPLPLGESRGEGAGIIQKPPPPIPPEWDADRRELRYQGQVIKRFRVPAANQALILTAFQEDGWPHSIDDPLPQHGDLDPKQRLQATIKSLNRNQLVRLIRFHGNGNGLQMYWEAITSDGHKSRCRSRKR